MLDSGIFQRHLLVRVSPLMGQLKPKPPAYPPGVQSAVDYADDVIAGRVDAGHLVHLACERFKRDRDEGTWEFRPELAERAMKFAGSMPNSKGLEAGKALRLMPWQRLCSPTCSGSLSLARTHGGSGRVWCSCPAAMARPRLRPQWRCT